MFHIHPVDNVVNLKLPDRVGTCAAFVYQYQNFRSTAGQMALTLTVSSKYFRSAHFAWTGAGICFYLVNGPRLKVLDDHVIVLC